MNPRKRHLTPCQRKARARILARQAAAGPQRMCGECEACCYAIAIPETGAGPFTPCSYQRSITTAWPAAGPRKCGCSIYPVGDAEDRRPPNCQQWRCAWLNGLALDDIPEAQLRPDKCGVVAYPMPNTVWGTVFAMAEAAQNGLETPMAKYIIQRLSKKMLVLTIGPHTRALRGPPDQLRKAEAAGRAAIEKRGAKCPISDP